MDQCDLRALHCLCTQCQQSGNLRCVRRNWTDRNAHRQCRASLRPVSQAWGMVLTCHGFYPRCHIVFVCDCFAALHV